MLRNSRTDYSLPEPRVGTRTITLDYDVKKEAQRRRNLLANGFRDPAPDTSTPAE